MHAIIGIVNYPVAHRSDHNHKKERNPYLGKEKMEYTAWLSGIIWWVLFRYILAMAYEKKGKA